MPLTVHHLAQQVGMSVAFVEELAALVSTGSPLAFTSQTVRKKRGGVREIIRPSRTLDMAVKNLNRSFAADLPYRPPDHVHGFVQGRSTLTNASRHLGARCVLRVDLEDFFPSIRAATVGERLADQGYDAKAAELLVKLVTVDRKLPVGLSTSPYLSNLVFEETDHALAKYAASANLAFTRYVDDLAFSPDPSGDDLVEIQRILDHAGWSVNSHKTAFMRRGGPQYVTGLYVGLDDRPRIPRDVKRRLRWIVHIIDKVGYDSYMTEFKGNALGMRPERLRGWACYLAAVEPNLGYPLLRRLEEILPDGYTDEAGWVQQGTD